MFFYYSLYVCSLVFCLLLSILYVPCSCTVLRIVSPHDYSCLFSICVIYVFLLKEFMYSYCCLCTCILIVGPCILIVVYVVLLLSMYSYCSSMYLIFVYVYLLLSMYSYCCLCILNVIYVFLDAATLTEVFPCFFLGCKANARV